ncbi:MAG: hypothetical protein ACT443_12670 [Gemmatimonadota bacterium]
MIEVAGEGERGIVQQNAFAECCLHQNACATQYAQRERICDLGYLRNAYRRPDGRIG